MMIEFLMIYLNFFKPLIDKTVAFFLIVLLILPMVFIYIAIFFKMGSPVVFKQPRPGKNGRIFYIYKFRTMTNEKDSDGNLLPDHLRLKGFGALIRSLSLDELPQLFNVLKGDMSFIGPRPLLVEYLELYNNEQKKRHLVKPGITGLAQINGRNAISWKKKFEYDVEYVNGVSFFMDLKIILKTIKKVFIKEGITQDGHVSVEKFNGNN